LRWDGGARSSTRWELDDWDQSLPWHRGGHVVRWACESTLPCAIRRRDGSRRGAKPPAGQEHAASTCCRVPDGVGKQASRGADPGLGARPIGQAAEENPSPGI